MASQTAVNEGAARAVDGHREVVRGGPPFRVGVAHEQGDVRVRPIGDVDMATVGRLRARIDEAFAARADRIVLDLRAATFLDSAGLHLAVDSDRRATRRGIAFVIIAGPPAVQHAFDATGLSARLPFVDGSQLLSHASGDGLPAAGPPR